jgi:hypothetical protein
MSEIKTTENNNSEENKDDYLEALNNYYKLKSTYENDFNKEKNKITNNSNLSWKEKRREFKLLKKKCINCKRPVGTLFTNYYNEKDFSRVLKVICGDIQNPCLLNIIINIGYYDYIPEIILLDEKDIEEAKVSIIKDKNNLLFGYITTEQALANFEKFKQEITGITSSLEIVNNLFNDVIDNQEKKDLFKKNQLECFNLIDEIKKIIKEYNNTNNTLLIQDAVSIYVNKLTPKLKQVTSLKYITNRVDYIEEDSSYHLIQEKYNVQSLEYNYGKVEVIKYNLGLGKEKSSEENKLYISDNTKSTKNNTDSDNDVFFQNVVDNNMLNDFFNE